MPSVERRPNGSIVITVRITLRPGRDDDLIDLLLSAPPRGLARTIREAMRVGVRGTGQVETEAEDFDLPDLSIEI